MKAMFHTIGCKVNQYETRVMRKRFEAAGHATYDFTDHDIFQPLYADARSSHDGFEEFVIVINSCTVTGESDRKLRQILRRYRRDYPDSIIVLTGCMPQAFPDVAESFLEADIILGNASRKDTLSFVDRFIMTQSRIVEVTAHTKDFEEMEISEFEGRTRAFIKIQDGCNSFCSYCIIPYARGRIRSKKLEDFKHEVASLAAEGYKEVVLVGINLTSYGSDINANLADAVDVACSTEGIERVRMGSLDPDMIDEEMILRFSKAGHKLCPQFHLSLQSGCDETLSRMRRRYNTADFLKVCDGLRTQFPRCAITTDIMVGFPGETEEEFETTLRFMETVGFAEAHVFAYSPRAGTPAAKASNQVDKQTKHKRSKKMIELVSRLKDDYLDQFVGETVFVLPERVIEGRLEGHCREYFLVRFDVPNEKTEQDYMNGIVKVIIKSHEKGICFGEIISEHK